MENKPGTMDPVPNLESVTGLILKSGWEMGFIKVSTAFSAVIVVMGMSLSAQAEVITDGSLGATTALTGPNFLINEGLGQVSGGNLFHSFSGFSLTSSETATFTGASSINNIIARVTGSSFSSIDGTIDTSAYASANLFLMNPNGIMFGSNATLNVNGSFHATTADYIKSSNGETFFADPSASSVLSAATPSDFGFLSSNPAGISLAGTFFNFEVPDGETLSLIGGDIDIDSSVVNIFGGRINLAAVGSAGEVGLEANDLTMTGFTSLGDINLVNGSLLRVDGAPSGDIYIRGGNFTMNDSIIDAEVVGGSTAGGVIDIDLAGTFELYHSNWQNGIRSRSFSSGTAGSINISADTIHVIDGSIITAAESSGDAGALNLQANTILLENFATISSDTFSGGDAGALTVTANDLTLNDIASINSDTYGFGDAGDVTVTADHLVMTGSSYITSDSLGFGDAADVQVTATNIEMYDNSFIASDAYESGVGGNVMVNGDVIVLNGDSRISSNSYDFGDGGDVIVNGGLITMNDSGQISSDGQYFGNSGSVIVTADDVAMNGTSYISSDGEFFGNAGSVSVTANNSIVLNDSSRISSDNDFLGFGGAVSVTSASLTLNDSSRISATAKDGAFFDAGDISINVGNLSLNDSSSIASTNGGFGSGGTVDITTTGGISISGNANINTDTSGSGDGGTVNIVAGGALSMNGGSITTDTSYIGNGGSINVTASDIAMSNGALISAVSTGAGSGNAGDINLMPVSSLTMDNSFITTEAESADGGNINIFTRDLVYLHDSAITTTVRSGVGNGGNINIDPTFVILDNSQIIANAFGGNGGNINIVADYFITTPGSLVQASSQLGIDGNVTIDAVQTDISGDLTELPANYLNATALLRQPCAARTLQRSSLIVAGRGALPTAPGAMLGAGISDLSGSNKQASANTQLAGASSSLNCGG